MKKIFCALVVVMTLSALTGCGLKGPLYFPPSDNEKTPTTQNASNEAPVQTTPTRHDHGTDESHTQVIY